MKRRIFIIFFYQLIILFPLLLQGQDRKIVIHKLDKTLGLSSNLIMDCIEDSQGFIWIATASGLDRFDGNVVKRYYHDPNDSTSIHSEKARSFCLDHKGRLWIGTNDGLCRYIPETDNFKNFPYHPESHPVEKSRINRMWTDNQQRIWLFQSQINQLSLFDAEQEKLLFTLGKGIHKDNKLPAGRISFQTIDSKGRLWLRFDEAILCLTYSNSGYKILHSVNRRLREETDFRMVFEASNGKFYTGSQGLHIMKINAGKNIETQKIDVFPYQNPKFGDDFTIENINEDTEGKLWISTRYHGLITYDLQTEKVERYNEQNSFISNTLFKTERDKHGNMWIFAPNKFMYLKKKGEESFLKFQYKETDITSLSEFTARVDVPQVFMNKSGVTWFNTINSGINYFDLDKAQFVLFRHEDDNPNSLKTNELWAICEDSQGRIWMGTDGLDMYDPQTGIIQNFSGGQGTSTYNISGPIMSICEISPNNFLVGTRGTAYWLKYQDGKMTKVKALSPIAKDPNSLIAWGARYIMKDKNGIIWIATPLGVSCYKRPNKKNPRDLFINYQHKPDDPNSLSGNTVWYIYEDSQSRLWFCIDGYNLCYLDKDRKKFTRVIPVFKDKSTYERGAKSIVESPTGVFWLATEGGGLIKYDEKQAIFTQYTKKDGLPTNNLFSVFIDKNGLIWSSSDKGLIRFNPQTEKVQIFAKSDGLQDDEFKAGAFHQGTKTGHIYVGGNKGLNSFDPSNIKTSAYQPRLVFTDLKLFNEEIIPNQEVNGRVLLSNSINYSKKISLNYDENIFSIGFTAIQYASPRKIRYQYWLENFEKEATIVEQEDARVNYSGLPPGNYILHIKSTNYDGIWQENEKLLQIVIMPPWWKTLWFRIFLILLIVSLSISIYRLRLANYKQHQIELTRLVKEKTQQLDQQNKNLELIIGIGQKLTSSIDARQIIEEVYTEVNELMDAPIFSIGIINHLKSAIEYWTYKENEGSLKFDEVSLSEEDRLSVWCLKNRQTVIMNDVEKQSQQYLGKSISSYTGKGRPKSAIYLPMYDHTRQVMGILIVKSLQKNAYSPTDIELLKSMASYIAIALDNATAYQTIKEQEESKTRFFNNVSHEFKTPLTLISGPLQHALQNKIVRKEAGEELQLIQRNAERLEKMIGQLLTLRSIEKGTEKLQISKSNLIVFCQNIYNSFIHLATQKKLNFNFIQGEIIDTPTYFDQDKLEKIIYNLLSNAIKFTNKGGFVDFKIELNEQTAQILIKDSGIGIKKENQQKIFDRFYKKNQENKGGTGIGLSLVKELIDMHKGSIHLKSEENVGTEFTLLIPINPESYPNSIIKENKNLAPANVNGSYNKDLKDFEYAQDKASDVLEDRNKVLIVEDNIDIRKFLHLSLRNEFKILEADNGKEGLDIALAEFPDIILTDVMMPIMDGISFCKKIKADIRLSHIPVIMLTALSSEAKQIEGLKVGAEDYILKPFNHEVVQLKISNWMKSLEEQQKKFGNSNLKEVLSLSNNSTEQQFLEQAVEIIRHQITNNEFGNDIFIKKMGMSRAHLYRKLKSLTGKSLSEFITSVKMKYAQELLLQKELNISQIAYTLGYDIPSHFTRAFKNEFGITPSQFSLKK